MHRKQQQLKRSASAASAAATDGSNGMARPRLLNSNEAVNSPAGWQLYFPLIEWQPLLYENWLNTFRTVVPQMFPDISVKELRSNDGQLRVEFDSLIRAYDELEQQMQIILNEDGTVEGPDGGGESTGGERLKQFLIDQPSVVLGLLALAAHQFIIAESSSSSSSSFSSFSSSSPTGGNDQHRPLPVVFIEVRLFGYHQYTAMKDLKAQMIGKLVSVRGTVVRISSVKSLIMQIEFICSQCGNRQVKHLDEGRYAVPNKCTTAGCKSKAFIADRDSCRTVSRDMQRVRVQEKLATSGDAGRVPRTVEIECQGYLVDRVIPGDLISITGIVKYTQVSDGGKARGGNKMAAMHVLYIEANSIMHGAGHHSSDDGHQTQRETAEGDGEACESACQGKDQMNFDQRDLDAIREIAGEPDLFRLLVHSLCPSIFGHEMVKAGLLLALFGGRRRYNQFDGSDGSSSVRIRGDSHVLIVGDPGLGKSQMLSAVVQTAPRGVYVCSNTTTSSGLTVTLTKEAGSNEFSLEAGALVLGDQGCCCIDEFDKLNEFDSLLEAMEQQSISIAKGGILCSLPARTSVIAAANPIGGHYNKAKTVSENLKMNTALLSRFDLIFILLDRPDEAMDRFLSNHVMRIHGGSGQSDPGSARDERHIARGPDTVDPNHPSISAASSGLQNRLKLQQGEQLDTIPSPLLRRYIAYARQYVQPRLTAESAAVLQDFYMQLRQNHRSADTTPITTRQLESMIRLSEARARSELRQQVTRQDALEVVEIMRKSLFDTYNDEYGQPQFQRSQMGTGMSRKGEIKRFVGKLHDLHRQSYNNLFTFQQLHQIAREISISYGENFKDFLELVNHQNYLIKTGGNAYKLSNTS